MKVIFIVIANKLIDFENTGGIFKKFNTVEDLQIISIRVGESIILKIISIENSIISRTKND